MFQFTPQNINRHGGAAHRQGIGLIGPCGTGGVKKLFGQGREAGGHGRSVRL